VIILDTEYSRALWKDVSNARPLATRPEDAVWRVSVRPSSGPSILEALRPDNAGGFLDWGGGLVWLAGPADTATHAAVENAARAANGTWTLMRAPDMLRTAVRVVPDEAAPLARITREVKAAMDPAGILNPGRLYAGL
jgi:glycolate oxidase FAD binding subunit